MADGDGNFDSAKYWAEQIATAEKEPRRKQWLDVGQAFYRRLALEGENMTMRRGVSDAGRVDIYNLLYSNVKIQLPMLYSRLPEPHIQRKFGNRDPVARMAATIAERATMVDIDQDDFDDQATRLALDRLVVGRGVLRVMYEHSVRNSRIPVREENRERGEPEYVTEAGDTIPGKMVEQDDRGMFVMDSETVREGAPLCYHFWRDFLLGPGRTWKDVLKSGWLDWQCFMTKADAARRFDQKTADMLSYSYSPHQLNDSRADARVNDGKEGSPGHLVKVHEIWDAKSRKVIWLADGSAGGGSILLDQQDDPLGLRDFFNTPRPLMALTTNESLIPTPDYAQYRPQAAEMDQVTAKIGVLIDGLRPGGVYDGNSDGLGLFLEGPGEWRPVDNWESFASKGGIAGAIQQFDNMPLMGVISGLYEHRENVKRDADMIAGIPDVFRGQQAERDERLGQTHKRTSLGGLRVNDDQRDFQRYLSEALALKTEVIVRHFDPSRILQMADVEALIKESPKVAQLDIMAESPQGEQVLGLAQKARQIEAQQALTGQPAPPIEPQEAQMMAQALQTFRQWQQQRQKAINDQMQLIRSALQLLKTDNMRTFKLSIETDATVAVDEAEEKAQAGEFVQTISQMLNEVLSSQAIAQSPELKALAAKMLLFVVRRYRIGRSLEQDFEDTITKLVTAPPTPPPPDPLMKDVERQEKKDQMDAQADQRELAIKAFQANIDAYEAVTARQKAAADAMDAAKEGDLRALDLANRILETPLPDRGNGAI